MGIWLSVPVASSMLSLCLLTRCFFKFPRSFHTYLHWGQAHGLQFLLSCWRSICLLKYPSLSGYGQFWIGRSSFVCIILCSFIRCLVPNSLPQISQSTSFRPSVIVNVNNSHYHTISQWKRTMGFKWPPIKSHRNIFDLHKWLFYLLDYISLSKISKCGDCKCT